MSQENDTADSVLDSRSTKNSADAYRKELENICYQALQAAQTKNKIEINLTHEKLAEWSEIPERTLRDLFNGKTKQPNRQTREKLKYFLEIDNDNLTSLLLNFANPSLIKSKDLIDTLPFSDSVELGNVLEGSAETDKITSSNSLGPEKQRKFFRPFIRYNTKKIAVVTVATASFAVFILIHNIRQEQVSSNLNSLTPGSCVVDFSVAQADKKKCQGFGEFLTSGPFMGVWADKVTAINVPAKWTVFAKFEKWEPPNYQQIAEDGQGYILLETGVNLFVEHSYDLYRDFELQEFVRTLQPPELNDRIQHLVITSAHSYKPLVIHKHKDLNRPEILSIKFEDLSINN